MNRGTSVGIGTMILALILFVSVNLCASEAGAQAPTDKVTMRLDWKPGAQHAPFYFAREKGYYAKEGIDLTLISGSGSSDALKQVGSGSVTISIVDAMVLAQGLEQKVPVKSVAVYFQNTPFTLMSPKAKPITDVKQLTTGIKVGRRKASATYQGLLALLSANDIKPEQLNMVDIGFGVQPLLVRLIDVMIGSTITDPIEAEEAGMAVHEMLIHQHGVNVYGFTITVHNELIAKSGDLITRFVRATKKGVEELPKEQDFAVQALVKAVPELDPVRERKVLERTLQFLSGKDAASGGFGWQDEKRWEQTIATAKSLGLVERPPAAKDVFTNAYTK